MKPDELMKQCEDALADPVLSCGGHVVLKIPFPKSRSRNEDYGAVSLFGGRGPRAKIVGSTMDRLIVWVDAKKLLKFLRTNLLKEHEAE